MKPPLKRIIEPYRAITELRCSNDMTKTKRITNIEEDLIALKPIRKNGKMAKQVFDAAAKDIIEGKKPNMVQLHRDAGYSESASLCQKAMRTATWKQLKDSIPKNLIMGKWMELAFENADKRTVIPALENLGKILGLYEASKLKIETYNEKTEEFLEEIE